MTIAACFTAHHHFASQCRALLALCLLIGLPAWATPPAPSANAAASGNAVMVTRDANGIVTGTMPNPEAAIPLDRKETGSGSSIRAGGAAFSGIRLLNQVLALALVLVIAYVVMLALQKFQGRWASRTPLTGGRPSRMIRVLESASIGQGRGLHLVQVGGRCLLVGTSLQQVSLLGDVTADDAVQHLLAQGQTPEAAGDIPPVFQQLLQRYGVMTTDDTTGPADASEKESR